MKSSLDGTRGDGINYTSVLAGGASAPGWKVHTWPPRPAQYIRFYGVTRATS